jgi:hypothetical protein
LSEVQVLALNEVAGVLDTAGLVHTGRQIAAGAGPAQVADGFLAEHPLGDQTLAQHRSRRHRGDQPLIARSRPAGARTESPGVIADQHASLAPADAVEVYSRRFLRSRGGELLVDGLGHLVTLTGDLVGTVAT